MPLKSHLLFWLLVNHAAVAFSQKQQLTGNKTVDPLKTHVLNLLKERQEIVSFYQQCSAQLNPVRRSLQLAMMRTDFNTLKRDLNQMYALPNNPDREIIYSLCKEVCKSNGQERKAQMDNGQQKITDESVFTEYKRLLSFLEKRLTEQIYLDQDLNTPFWKRMEQFFIEPFKFLGVSSAYVYEAVNRSTMVSSKPDAMRKTCVEELLTKCRKFITYYHICTYYLETSKQDLPYRILAQSATKLRLDLEKIKSERFVEMIKKDFWNGDEMVTDVDSAFRKYGFLYNLLENHLKYYVQNDTDLESEYWKRIITFLNEPSGFSEITSVSTLDLYGFGPSDQIGPSDHTVNVERKNITQGTSSKTQECAATSQTKLTKTESIWSRFPSVYISLWD